MLHSFKRQRQEESSWSKTKIYKKLYQRDIWRESGNVKVKGLLHSKLKEEYESEWKHLKKIWLNREKRSDKFVSYLRKHKKQKWLESMVHFVQKSNGLGEPAEEYNQNASECIDSLKEAISSSIMRSCHKKKT